MIWEREHAELIMDPGTDPQAAAKDMRHAALKASGYEMLHEGPAQAPVIIWWRHGIRIGSTTLAMQDRERVIGDVEDAIEFLHSEGYVTARSGSLSDPRTMPRLTLAAILLGALVLFFLGRLG